MISPRAEQARGAKFCKETRARTHTHTVYLFCVCISPFHFLFTQNPPPVRSAVRLAARAAKAGAFVCACVQQWRAYDVASPSKEDSSSNNNNCNHNNIATMRLPALGACARAENRRQRTARHTVIVVGFSLSFGGATANARAAHQVQVQVRQGLADLQPNIFAFL